jgi:threonylcarbamoyladenosine tRNA methylthiotransferase MtaB
MPQVPSAVGRERARALRERAAAALDRSLAGRVGTDAAVLAERGGGGRSEHYAPVRLAAPAAEGTIVRVRLTGVADGRLIGEAS